MPNYARSFLPGGTFFFTVVTNYREPLFASPHARAILDVSMRSVFAERPVQRIGGILLPDHLHCVWRLPEDDAGYPTRWKMIKARFTKAWLASGGEETARSESRIRRCERGVWQRRFWEHTVRNEKELGKILDYIHYNPVKHKCAGCPHDWPHSSFKRYVVAGVYQENWACSCREGTAPPPWCHEMEGIHPE